MGSCSFIRPYEDIDTCHQSKTVLGLKKQMTDADEKQKLN